MTAPFPTQHHDEPAISETNELAPLSPYQAAIGSLMWTSACTRPDISFATNFLARFIAYLNKTREYGLVLGGEVGKGLEGWVNADFAGCKVTRRSTTGYIFKLCDSVISWMSKGQGSVTTSTLEVECVAMAEAAKEARWLSGLVKELVNFKGIVTLKCDKKGAFALANNPGVHTRTKHIEYRHHFIREQVSNGQIQLVYVPTNDQQADILTKALLGKRHLKNMEDLRRRHDPLAPETLDFYETSIEFDPTCDLVVVFPVPLQIASVRASQGELFYLRAILNAYSARFFGELKTVYGVEYCTFQEAARMLGLFVAENKAQMALREGLANFLTPATLRGLFTFCLVCTRAELVVHDRPLLRWEEYGEVMAQDFTLHALNDLDRGKERALQEIGRMLGEHGKSLADFGLPVPNDFEGEVGHHISLFADRRVELRAEAVMRLNHLNPEQRVIYDEIMGAVMGGRPACMFIDGKAGRGKTYLVAALLDRLQSDGKIPLVGVSAAFAALLYEGGITIHSLFKVPVNERNEELASLVTPHFRCAPVIRGGTRAEIVEASMRTSYLWRHFTVHRLITPIRHAAGIELANMVDMVGDGTTPLQDDVVDLSMIPTALTGEELTDFVFPHNICSDAVACLHRSILCATNRQCDLYNSNIILTINGEERVSYSHDTIKEVEALDTVDSLALQPHTQRDVLHAQTPPGVPSHVLSNKVNTIIRLLHNFSQERGLVKIVRLKVTAVGRQTVTCQLIGEANGVGMLQPHTILIPRITFEYPLPRKGFTLQRKQFPLAPAYATTFNSCQGLTLHQVGLDVSSSAFSQGKLYTVVSRFSRGRMGGCTMARRIQ
ncbi:hypothetical protein M231_07787 [Tremella mesenterica]|uniref:ATP-dependent DNA helicase n=1 Tax=Tremella mesenterica TaxID=5217 RepID=A0A4Q1BBC6_TREME|nr:hypothetical protein M231_07787 [Tremella mesenterica]